MLLKTDTNIDIDDVQINFDESGLWILNIAIAIIMFGVALGITLNDFKQLFKNPKIVFVGVFLKTKFEGGRHSTRIKKI